MTAQQDQLNGLLVVDKPGRGDATGIHGGYARYGARTRTTSPDDRAAPDAARLPTSHDIVQCVRRWSGQQRIGHTGTLDPMASGVLVLCIGTATRLVEYYQGETKQYYAEVLLGYATDTYDAVGAITHSAPVPILDPSLVETALKQFRGEIRQRPPSFSAIKRGGVPLYQKALRGEQVVVDERAITIYRLDLLSIEPPDRLMLRVVCSAGAYMRSLADDIGRALGTHGMLAALRREAVGQFTIEMAHSLATIEQAARAGHLRDLLLPPGTSLPMPSASLSADILQRFGFGQNVKLKSEQCSPQYELAMACDDQGRLAGIVRCLEAADDGSSWLWKAEKWLA